jgi:N-acetylglucosaminyldiphosphoundecaprenol N-acetyl-beta-D-mannosaminyltransferase
MTALGVRGVLISTAPFGDVMTCIERWIAVRGRGVVCCANVHLIETARRDPRVARAVAEAELVLPDGAPVAWVMRRLGANHVRRISGSDIFAELCARSSARGYRHFFLGSTEETLRLATANLERRTIRIAGTYAPPYVPLAAMDLEDAVRRINETEPDILWVGLGAPKQELWISATRPLLSVPVVCGVGAVFDFVAGTKPRAPRAVQRAGLEWAFRVGVEPRRLWRRYLTTNASFIAGVPGILAQGGRFGG